MTQITVTSVEAKQSKDGKTTFYNVWDNILAYSTFDSGVMNLRPGDIIEATVETKGKYKNITAYKVLPRTEITATSFLQQITPPHVGIPVITLPLTVSAELDSKARNTALMQACEMAKAASLIHTNEEAVLYIADKFYRWLKGEAPKMENPTTDTDKGVKKSPSVSSKAKTAPYEDSPAGRSALVSDYVRKGMPLTGENGVYDLLGIKTPAEIIDIDEAVKTLEAHTAKKV